MRSLKKRYVMSTIGIFLTGLGVGAYRMSSLGVDPFSCMNLAISSFLVNLFKMPPGTSILGTWQLILNIVLLIYVFFNMRKFIGYGTIVNMVSIGYMSDFIYFIFNKFGWNNPSLALRFLLLAIGTLLIAIGLALYMEAEVGIAPYDSLGYIIEEKSNGKIPFNIARVSTDGICIIIGIAFCLAYGGKLTAIVGIGTVCNAVLNGPLIQFFRTNLASKI